MLCFFFFLKKNQVDKTTNANFIVYAEINNINGFNLRTLPVLTIRGICKKKTFQRFQHLLKYFFVSYTRPTNSNLLQIKTPIINMDIILLVTLKYV